VVCLSTHFSISTMPQLHAANRYDRLTHDIETITGKPATSVRDFVAGHADQFRPDLQAKGVVILPLSSQLSNFSHLSAGVALSTPAAGL
jgi:hypothetical protein